MILSYFFKHCKICKRYLEFLKWRESIFRTPSYVMNSMNCMNSNNDKKESGKESPIFNERNSLVKPPTFIPLSEGFLPTFQFLLL